MNIKTNIIASSLVALVIFATAVSAAGWRAVTGEDLKTLIVNNTWIYADWKEYFREDGKQLLIDEGWHAISEWKIQDDGHGYCVHESCYVVQTKKGKYRVKGESGPYKGGTWKIKEIKNGSIDFGIATTRMLDTSLVQMDLLQELP